MKREVRDLAQATIFQSSLRLVFETGFDQEGKPILKSRTYSNLNVAATPDQVYRAAQALASLTSHPLYSVERNDRSEIYENE